MHHTDGFDSGWIEEAKERGWGNLLYTALDVIEPFGAFGAQFIWITQPFVGMFISQETVKAFGETIETPEGIAWLREQLRD